MSEVFQNPSEGSPGRSVLSEEQTPQVVVSRGSCEKEERV